MITLNNLPQMHLELLKKNQEIAEATGDLVIKLLIKLQKSQKHFASE